jgi:hypothetical protein
MRLEKILAERLTMDAQGNDQHTMQYIRLCNSCKLLQTFKIMNQMLLANAKLFSEKKPYCKAENKTINNLSTLASLRNTVGLPIKKKNSNG